MASSRREGAPDPEASRPEASSLEASSLQGSHDRGRRLLDLARGAIERELGLRGYAERGEEQDREQEDERWLRQPGAVFVTLTKEERLRGCIGSLEATRPLAIDVESNAVSAAMRDPRFPEVTKAELSQIEIEVSLLSSPEPIAFRNEVEALAALRCGVDGVVFEWRGRRATFLPQMWEVFESPEVFVGELKHKAGLERDFWDEGVRLLRYTVICWREGE